jgi:hypothetical protein
MTLPATGTLSMSQIATELGLSQTGLSLNHSWIRALAQRPSGSVSYSSLRGQSGHFSGTINVNAGTGGASQAMPFFGGGTNSTSSVNQSNNGDGTFFVQVGFSPAPPDYSGNIILSDFTTGQTTILTPTGGGLWQNSASQQVLVAGNNSISIFPHT